MKITKIIGIMKTFTNFSLSFQADDTPAPRVILPTLWGASPHLLGGRAWRRGPLAKESASRPGATVPGRGAAPPPYGGQIVEFEGKAGKVGASSELPWFF